MKAKKSGSATIQRGRFGAETFRCRDDSAPNFILVQNQRILVIVLTEGLSKVNQTLKTSKFF